MAKRKCKRRTQDSKNLNVGNETTGQDKKEKIQTRQKRKYRRRSERKR